MGKKKQKKGKGAEKTAMKTEKNLAKKTKKTLAETGEDDIENMIAEFQAQDKKKTQIIEEKCKPSPRCNMSLTAHPDKEELIMFGGEYFNGSKTFLYNDLFVFNIKKNEWTKLIVPNPPPPRSAHQAVALKQGGGQLWIFGGEFASPTQSQFYHYKDIWMFSLKEKTWQKMSSSGCPSSRSGHRMAVYKKMLIVFGGFHDNIRDCRYFNDVGAFNLETYQWMKLDISGTPPPARSACQMVSTDNNRLLVFGGYSKEKVKKDIEKGVVHSDMYILVPDEKGEETSTPSKWKWQPLKQSGDRPSPRTGFSMTTVPGNKAVLFGGVHDEEDTEEDVQGIFHNDAYILELDKGKWHNFILRGKRAATQEKKRRRKKEDSEDGDNDEEDTELSNEGDAEMEEDIEKLNLTETTYDDGIFKVTVAAQSENNSESADVNMASDTEQTIFVPNARMNSLLCVKGGQLFMYGGMFEQEDKQFTLDDFYCLDIQRQDEWVVLDKGSIDQQEWFGSDSEDEDDDEEGDDKDEEDDDDDDEDEMDVEIPDINKGEGLANYYARTKDFWTEFVLNDMSPDEQESTKADVIKQMGYKMCREIHKQNAS